MSYSTGLFGERRLGIGAYYFDAYPISAGPVSVTVSASPISNVLRALKGIESTGELIKYDYITLCGIPNSTARFGINRMINLVEYLPQNLRGGDEESFLQMFEDFLNQMYQNEYEGLRESEISSLESQTLSASTSGTYYAFGKAFQLSANESRTVSATVNTIVYDDSYLYPEDSTEIPSISILEKITRLTELHDPALMDSDYLQYFANYLGYNININRGEIGIISQLNKDTTLVDGCSALDEEKYLRFVVENLPSWYKIKTTKNAAKVMLYSFGIIGDLVTYFTKAGSVKGDKNQDGIDDFDGFANGYSGFKLSREDNFSDIVSSASSDVWYPSPHFAISINLDQSVTDYSFDYEKRDQIINAIESIRPINTVFKQVDAWVKRSLTLSVNCNSKMDLFVYIPWQ